MDSVQAPHPSREQLAAFGLGKLGAEESAAVESHVGQCDSCCQFLKEVVDDTLVVLLRDSETESEFGAAGAKADAGAATIDAAFPSGRGGGTEVEPLGVELDVPEELADHPPQHAARCCVSPARKPWFQRRQKAHKPASRALATGRIGPEEPTRRRRAINSVPGKFWLRRGVGGRHGGPGRCGL